MTTEEDQVQSLVIPRKSFKMEEYVPTQYEQAIIDARGNALQLLEESKTSVEHMMYTHAARSLTYTKMSWQEGYFESPPTQDDLLDQFTSDEQIKKWEAEEQHALEMLKVAAELPGDNEDFRMVVAQFGDGAASDSYRALCVYPSDEKAGYDLSLTGG